MSLLDQLGGMLQQYKDGGAPANPEQATQHFDEVARQAPTGSLAGALTGVFNSPETGTFGQNISSMFGASNPDQRAGILNKILPSLGAGGLSSLGGLLSPGLLGSLTSGGQVTPEAAQQVSPAAAGQIAEQARAQNPSIVDQAGSFYAQHPTLVKSLGAAAALMALRHLASAEQ